MSVGFLVTVLATTGRYIMAKGSLTNARPGVWRMRVVVGYKENGDPIQKILAGNLPVTDRLISGRLRHTDPPGELRGQ
jgi:hypothetical protein